MKVPGPDSLILTPFLIIQSLRAFRRACTVGYVLFGRVVLVTVVVLVTLLVLVTRFVLVTNRASHITR